MLARVEFNVAETGRDGRRYERVDVPFYPAYHQ